MRRVLAIVLTTLLFILPASHRPSYSQSMTDYCYIPPFLGSVMNAPPLVMLVVSRDHKLYHEAYNDASDLDEDGRIDVGYKHNIDYYGYFDPYKCYRYEGSGANAKFVPTRRTTNKYCGGSGEWSGNFLNWLTMARIDVLRKALYGGYRSTDSVSETVLEATYIPQDAHSWGKEYEGPDTRKLTPFDPPQSGKRHLFCITSTAATGTRKIRVALNDENRIWTWASSARAVCGGPDTAHWFRHGPVATRNDIQDYFIRVRVCDSSVGLEPNCKRYPAGTYKPIGLLQEYGEGDGTKICSKSFRTCNSDADCNPHTVNGLCVDRAKMYFGLLTGSYTNNINGGVLRKNIWTLTDEIDPNTGIFKTSVNTEGNIILTLNRLTTIGFRYGNPNYPTPEDYTYDCGWTMRVSECKMWGNPIAEMMYEALRYLAGRPFPTSFFDYSGYSDFGLDLPKPDWGIRRGNTYYRPYEIFPTCSRPFLLVISDINNNYDSDSVPGSSFNTFLWGDLTGLDVTSLANRISSVEGVSGSYFIGESGGFSDFICSAKNVSSLANIRGLCPEEPTKRGSFYPASIAYYGNSIWRNNFSGNRPPNVKTYSVVLSSPIPDIAVKVGTNVVRITPIGKSVSGCGYIDYYCAYMCNLTRDATGNLIISNCSGSAYCPTNQIVDLYVDEIIYDNSNNLTRAKFRINFEDVEHGADYEMDAIVEYEIEAIGTNQIRVTLRSTYAYGCIDQVLGFTISGTTEDGTWLVVKDADTPNAGDYDTPYVVSQMPLEWSRTFTVTGNPAGQLKPPLWYAAKWGGFDDINNNGVPDLPQEWDKDGNGSPDTYSLVVNPLRMEEELEKAFTEILLRALSGATAATLASRTNVSSVVLQPYFYPKYVRPDGAEVSWIGFLRSFWVDTKQNLREDTNTNKILNIAGAVFDRIFQLVFDPQTSETKAMVLSAPDSESSCSLHSSMSANRLKPVFDAGCELAQREASSRRIFYNKNGSLAEFNTSESSSLRPVWGSIDSRLSNNNTLVACLIRYIRGEDVSEDSSCAPILPLRARELDAATLNDMCPSYNFSTTKTWKLGDIIYSTPFVVSSEPINAYHLRYNDGTYLEYIRRDSYRNRSSFAFVSANDGMLHAFRIGHISERRVCSNDIGRECGIDTDCPAGGFCIPDPNNPVKLVNSPTNNGTDLIAREEWAFIPRNAIPYLVWYGRQDYCHIPTVDYRTIVRDVSIGGPPNGTKSFGSWRTILIGTMGFGGKAITVGGTTYSSSVFALDLTDWLNGDSNRPALLWEVQLPDNTLALSFPAIIRQGAPNTNGNWYVVVGTGPKEAGDKPGVGGAEGYSNATKLYIINLRNGNIEKTIDLNLPPGVRAAVGDIKAVDVDNDYQDDVLYFGLYGKDVNGNSWGAYYRLPLRQGNSYRAVSDINSADISVALDLGTFATGNHRPPVFGGSTFTKDENGKLWVFFGTGKFLSSLDKAIPYDNYLVGFKDDCWNGTCSTTYNKSQLTDTTGSTTTATITQTKNMCVCDTNTCQSRAVVYETVSTAYPSEVPRGWYYKLVGEAIYSEPVIFGGIIDALTFVPPEDACKMEGSSNLIALYYKTGRPNPRPAILSPAAVSGNVGVGQSVNVLSKVSLGIGIPPIGAPLQITMGASQTRQYEKFAQISSGVVLRMTQQTAPGAEGRIILWIEK